MGKIKICGSCVFFDYGKDSTFCGHTEQPDQKLKKNAYWGGRCEKFEKLHRFGVSRSKREFMFLNKKNNPGLRYPEYDKTHISNVQVGDKINTVMGVETATRCDKARFSTDGHFGNIPYFEGRNDQIFSRILPNKTKENEQREKN